MDAYSLLIDLLATADEVGRRGVGRLGDLSLWRVRNIALLRCSSNSNSSFQGWKSFEVGWGGRGGGKVAVA